MKTKLFALLAASLFSLSALAATGAACCKSPAKCCPGSCCGATCCTSGANCCPSGCCK